jgi:glycine oxidase
MTIIIGAGIIGASIADELARRGEDVTVIDMRSAGRGASQASAGVLAPYIEANDDTPLLRMAVRSLTMFDDFIAGVRERTGLPVEYARTGTLDVALDDTQADRLRANLAWIRGAGVRAEWLDPPALRDVERTTSPEAAGALLIEEHGFVGVPRLVAGLVQSARLAGAVFESPVEAIDVTPRRDRVEVRAGDRTLTSDLVVIAAGCWSRRVRVAGVPALPVRPVRGQLLHLRWPQPPAPARVVWGADCYTVPWPDGTLLVGATVEDAGFDESITTSGLQSLTTAVSRLLPRAASAALIDARAGLRPASPDGLPFIGRLDRAPNVMMATGHYRNGILLAPLTAALVASSLLDREEDPMLAVTSPNRTWQEVSTS